MTKCVFHKYGPSGTIQKHDALCVMALNIINEKIYTFLWFWFFTLFVASLLGFLWRIISLALHKNVTFNKIVFSCTTSSNLNLKPIIKLISYSDWLYLVYLSKNIDKMVFQDFINNYLSQIDRFSYLHDLYKNKDWNAKEKDAASLLWRDTYIVIIYLFIYF